MSYATNPFGFGLQSGGAMWQEGGAYSTAMLEKNMKKKPLRGSSGKGECREFRRLRHKQCVGSRAQVMHRTAWKTSGGLTKKDLKYNKNGKIVSKKMSAAAKKSYKKRGLAKFRAPPFVSAKKQRPKKQEWEKVSWNPRARR